MKDASPRWSAPLLAAWLAALGAPSALACGYHGAMGDHLSAMHPSSIEVAVALRRAAESGALDLHALDAVGRRHGLYLETVEELQAFKRALWQSATDTHALPVFSIGLVESGLWTRLVPSNDRLVIDIHTDGPSAGETVLLTGEPVLARLIDGSLPAAAAMRQGLMVLEGDQHSQAALRRALTGLSAPPKQAAR